MRRPTERAEAGRIVGPQKEKGFSFALPMAVSDFGSKTSLRETRRRQRPHAGDADADTLRHPPRDGSQARRPPSAALSEAAVQRAPPDMFETVPNSPARAGFERTTIHFLRRSALLLRSAASTRRIRRKKLWLPSFR